MFDFQKVSIRYIYIYNKLYITTILYITTNLLGHEQLCLMMFNERYCIVYYAINLLCYKHWIGKWKYLTHISVIRKVLKSCRIKIVYLAHDVHGASSLYIKPCWQSLYRVFPPGGMGKSPHQPKICSCTPSQPNVYSPPLSPPPHTKSELNPIKKASFLTVVIAPVPYLF